MNVHLLKSRFLRDTAGEGGAGGGTPPMAPAKSSFLQEGAANGKPGDGSGGNGGDGAGGTPPGGDNPGGNGSANWFDSLPKELKEDAIINKFKSVEALAGAYKSAQKIIGADKIAVPGKHTTEEEWRQVFHKLGLPEKAEEYAIKFKEGSVLDADFQKGIQTQLHKLGVLPKQAQALVDWMVDESAKTLVDRGAKADEAFKKQEAELRALWGNSFDKNVHHADKFLREKGGADLYKYANERGWGGDAKFIQFLASAAEAVYGEAPALGEGGTGELAPKELDLEIMRLQKEPAYFDKNHPSHKAVVEEVKDLFAKRYPVDKK